MAKRYNTFAEAAERVDAIKHRTGRWPGIVANDDGTYSPSWNPGNLDPSVNGLVELVLGTHES